MLPNTKISATVMEFGKSILNGLPYDHSKQDMENVMKIVITVWNSIVMDGWHKTNEHELRLLDTLATMPKPIQLEFKRLIKRKKKKFGDDHRAVGNDWIREEGGELIFGCEARINIENVPLSEGNPKH